MYFILIIFAVLVWPLTFKWIDKFVLKIFKKEKKTDTPRPAPKPSEKDVFHIFVNSIDNPLFLLYNIQANSDG